MQQITAEQLIEKQNNGEKIVVDFFATWCGPCKALIPILESIEPEHQGVTFVKMDVDQNKDLALSLGIRTVPTVIFFEGTNEVKRNMGANIKPFYNKLVTESFGN